MDAASHVIAEVKAAAALMVASTHAFRTWDGRDLTVEEALAKVYVEESPQASDLEALHALGNIAVLTAPIGGIGLSKVGSPRSWRPRGSVVVEFRRIAKTIAPADPGATQRSYDNFAGALMQSNNPAQPGLAELDSADGMLDLHRIEADGPHRVRPEDVPSMGDVELYYVELFFGGDH